MFFVDEFDGVDRSCRTVEDQLRLLHDLPDADGAVAAAGADASFANSGVDSADAILMPEPETKGDYSF